MGLCKMQSMSAIDQLYESRGDNSYVRYGARGVVRVEGAESSDFLQKIISQDIGKADQDGMLRGCLLTPQGKYLHDFFISRAAEEQGVFYLECEGGERVHDLARRLMMYKLRADVRIEVSEATEVKIFKNCRTHEHNPMPAQKYGEEIPFQEWDRARIADGIMDGARDAEIGGSTLAELNLDDSAVNYQKGCYIGQELVARMRHRNLGKKHLVGVKFCGDLDGFSGYEWGHEFDDLGILRSHVRVSDNEIYALMLMMRAREQALIEEKTIKYGSMELHLLGL